MKHVKGCLIVMLLSLTCLSVPVHAEPDNLQDATSANQMAADGSVNINTASADLLASALKGIGIKRAQAIVEYRETNGPFTEAGQLQEIKGIGEAIIEQNMDKIRL